MIGYRQGVAIQICDHCYRPRRTGEPGWETFPNRFPAAPFRQHKPGSGDQQDEVEEGVQPAQDGHRCPTCAVA